MEKYAIDIDKLLDDFEETELSNSSAVAVKHLYESKRELVVAKPDVIPAFVDGDVDDENDCNRDAETSVSPVVEVEEEPKPKQDENVIKFDAIEISDDQLDRYINELEMAEEPEVVVSSVTKVERPKSLNVHQNLNESLPSDVFKCTSSQPLQPALESEPAITIEPETVVDSAVPVTLTPTVASTTEVFGANAPIWIPDNEAFNCMHCNAKFTLVKRRHHCRACGLVLCSKCCNLKYYLPYLNDEARICQRCYALVPAAAVTGDQRPLPRPILVNSSATLESSSLPSSPSATVATAGGDDRQQQQHRHRSRRPKATNSDHRSKNTKTVTFCDGIRPGQLIDWSKNELKLDPVTRSYIPAKNTGLLPPIGFRCRDTDQLWFVVPAWTYKD